MQLARVGEVFRVFLVLGLTSFGGPTAHLGYFQTEFVEKRKWLNSADYANTVALCQFLPGPASSQVGMAIGFRRASYLGMAVAWIAFTAPAAIALAIFAMLIGTLHVSPDQGWLKGLLAAAVAVVFHAVSSMASKLAKGRVEASIAVVAGGASLAWPSPYTHVGLIAAAALAGLAWCRPNGASQSEGSGRSVPVQIAVGCGVLFVALLALLPLVARMTNVPALDWIAAFYQAGALVFGGGHVVLPLLEQSTVAPGWLSEQEFLAGYSAAQAVPGPLFTFASYLGAVIGGTWGAVVTTVAIFFPSALLVLFGLHFWDRLSHSPRTQHAFAGANAAVVGLLAAALYDPVFTHGVTNIPSLSVAAACWLGMAKLGVPPWAVALGSALAGALLL